MTYDSWKTRNPDDETLGPKNLQQAADDAGTIAETVEALGKLLDKFHADHGEELYSKLERAFPLVSEFGGGAEKPIYDLAQQLTPPED